MKKLLTQFVLATSITLSIVTLNFTVSTNANIPTKSANIIYNSKRKIVGLKNLQIDGKIYNVQFIYGDFNQVYKGFKDPAITNIPDPVKATTAINSALNSLKPVPTTITEKPKRKYPGAYGLDLYMFPLQIVERTYKETSIEIYGAFGAFDKKAKQWKTETGRYVSHGPKTAGVYTKFNLVSSR